VWLGVAIGEGHLGKGLGSKVVSFLLNRAKAEHIKIVSLSVDVTNLAAISLYKRLGFEVIRNLNENVYLMECKTDAQC
ncbi:MAG: GNAT family N-acetyltransferase, partial [Pedobacter sp.]|nr:GNAT family N-acetyltransferase [Pedobacter sp.]